jgi:hypothetical protein
MPPRSAGYSRKNLTIEYLKNISSINSLYARTTLIKFFSTTQQAMHQPITEAKGIKEEVSFTNDLFGELKLHELISWSVQEEFSNCPFNGWQEDLNCAIPIKQLINDEAKSTGKASTTASERDPIEHLNLQKIIDETSDKIIVEKLL